MTSKNQNAGLSRLPALLAVSGSLAAFPASALELGEMNVQSGLGQPLRASIAYALSPNESLNSGCVSVTAGTASGLPGIGKATLNVSNGVISLIGEKPLREPMVSARVAINCPYTVRLVREYTLFVNPVAEVPAAAAKPAAAAPVAAAPVAQAPRATAKLTPDITIGARYQVQPGDSASRIVQRIEDRSMRLWPAVYALVDANPAAFENGDPNQLKAGTWLVIPTAIGSSITESAPQQLASKPVESAPVEATVIEEPPVESPSEPAVTEMLGDTTADLKPGDVVVEDTATVIPGSAAVEPETAAVSNDIVTTEAASTATPAWFWWVAGGAMALFAGFFAFGRRRKVDGAPLEPVGEMARRDDSSRTVEVLSDSYEVDEEYDLDDDSPTEENLVLDADLITGSGLEGGESSADAQDFGFAETTKLDVELPFEPEPAVTQETDILPPLHSDDIESILESEVLPEEADDEYDMSVIVDATKMPQPEDVTERDLMAVEVDDETMVAEQYTINKEADYQILEQDYLDEMTATQRLNEEIARAATELEEDLTETATDDDDISGETAILPMASVTELDVTAEMPAANNDEVVELDATAEIPVDTDESDDDETAQMQIESGKRG